MRNDGPKKKKNGGRTETELREQGERTVIRFFCEILASWLAGNIAGLTDGRFKIIAPKKKREGEEEEEEEAVRWFGSSITANEMSE